MVRVRGLEIAVENQIWDASLSIYLSVCLFFLIDPQFWGNGQFQEPRQVGHYLVQVFQLPNIDSYWWRTHAKLA